ncbi:MAG: hypothetical protein SFY81_05170 [Verrucomicrobiota bacterium]|nr:hypothetical protein [Verrucomicrobiota bacterium]
MQPGVELDRAIHTKLFGLVEDSIVPPYSTEEAEANKVKAKIKSLWGKPIVCGETRLRPKKWFARYDSDPSTSTEVLAESYPLAICRLAIVLAERR